MAGRASELTYYAKCETKALSGVGYRLLVAESGSDRLSCVDRIGCTYSRAKHLVVTLDIVSVALQSLCENTSESSETCALHDTALTMFCLEP